MTQKLRYILLFAGLISGAALSATAEAQSPTAGHTWPTHYERISLSLTCKEATVILKMHGYRDIAELSCAGDVYRFEVSRVEGRFVIDLDSHTGNIIRRQQL